MADDAADLDAARAGDLVAWGRIAARHAPILVAYLGSRIRRPVLVERLVAAALVAAWRHIGEADPGDLPGWLRRHAASQAMTWAGEHPSESLHEPLSEGCVPGDPDLGRRIARLDRAMGQLDESQLRVLELVFRGGADDRRTAEVLHVDPARVPHLLADAIEALDRIDASLAAG